MGFRVQAWVAMSITFMQEVVRITDRYFDRRDPDSIDRQGQLNQVVALVVIFHAIMGIGFAKMEEHERRHPRIIRDVNVAFEFSAPPPAPEFRVGEVPKAITLTEGENPDSGAASSAKPREADTVSLPTPKAPETLTTPTPEQAKPVVSHQTTVAPSVAVTTTQTIKAAPVQAPKKSLMLQNIASGAPKEGGGPEGKEGGVGDGGEGTGGSGKGEGDPGTGSGYGNVGGDIATRVSGGTRAMGNIGPYRKDLLMRIAQNWMHSKYHSEALTIQIIIGKEGQVLSTEIVESSGNKRADKEALAIIEGTEFAALPDWYKGDQLLFKIDLAKVEKYQQ
jgi:TonB family protein